MGKTNKPYSVYMHTCPNDKKYIGITCKKPEYRWDNGNGYRNNDHFFRAITKYGWENITHEILFSGLSKEEACEKEISLISEYGTNLYENGYNNTAGGEHALHTEETKRKIKEHHKDFTGANNPNFGKKRTAETIAKVYGSNNCRARAVCQYSISGELIKVFGCIKDAERETKISQGNISYCVSGKRKHAGGYVWRYEDGEIKSKIDPVDISRRGQNNSFYGRKHSDETREKLRAAWALRKARGNGQGQVIAQGYNSLLDENNNNKLSND